MSAYAGIRLTGIGLGLSLMGMTLGVAAEPVRIEVFTDTARFPVSGQPDIDAAVTVQDIGKPKRLEQQLSAGLPKTEAEAMAVAKQRFQGNLEALGAEFMAAYQSHTAAMSYGIQRYPALVFDGGRAVIYGVTDLRDGLVRYRRWLATQPASVLGPRAIRQDGEGD